MSSISRRRFLGQAVAGAGAAVIARSNILNAQSSLFESSKSLLSTSSTKPIDVLPVSVGKRALLLNGDWSFKYIPSLDATSDAGFYRRDFNVSGWTKIPVPANWEIQGFAEPHYYMDLQDGLGLYRRTFRLPPEWRGRIVCLRFEGVAFGFEAWINGKKIGVSDASAYNPNTFDITDALNSHPDDDNVLAVQVTTKSIAWKSDVNDDWDLSGIFRDVMLFPLPNVHFQDVTARTKLAADGTVDLSVAVAVSRPECEVSGTLRTPNGKTVNEFSLRPGTNGLHEAIIKVTQPQLWTAETPTLYRLLLSLSARDQEAQTFELLIGLREISIAEGVLLLNGRPIKLRGVNWIPENPKTGRVVSEADERRDLELMKRANINFVRIAHYPPNRSFLDLCDEIGFYVMDELPLSHVEGGNKSNEHYRSDIMARVKATITRDKNHPSVIIWGIGNENRLSDLLVNAGRFAKELNPTRRICFPMTPTVFREEYKLLPGFDDLYDEHYPGTIELIDLAQNLDKPAIFSEYAHANALATGKIQDQWAIMQSMPRLAGGAIWGFADQGLLRRSPTPVDINKPTMYVWPDKHHYYDTHGLDGCDGIVYSDRTPQPDYWETRKVYAPVQIPQTSVRVTPGNQEITLTVENRYDFRTLKNVRTAWALQRNHDVIQKGEVPLHAKSHETGVLRVPVNIPAGAATDVLMLNLHCMDENGLQINERTVKLELPDSNLDAWLASLPKNSTPIVTDSANAVKITFPKWVLTVERPTGTFTIHNSSGRILVAGIYPHCGRKLTGPERGRAKRMDTWRASILTENDMPAINVMREGPDVLLRVSGQYSRPDAPEQAFVGGYQAEITPSGAIAISYNYTLRNATGELPAAGFSVVVPAEMTDFRWIGQGPYAGYPGKDRLNEFGLFHLNREDLRFQGNRRGTALALLTTVKGEGVTLATTPGDIAVERDGKQTLLSHNAVISGLGNKGRSPDHLVDATKIRQIAGSFTLVPLENQWPTQLTRWFGEPDAADQIFHPFYHSYDQ